MAQITEKQKEQARLNKKNLIALCSKIQRDPEETCNEALVRHYEEITFQIDFRTFSQWKTSGKKVKKGEKGFPVWSSPIKIDKVKDGIKSETEKFNLFNICYLFHAGQVE